MPQIKSVSDNLWINNKRLLNSCGKTKNKETTMSKNLAIATALAAVAVSGMFGTGCASNKTSAEKPVKFAMLSDRGCIPPPYASPSQHSFTKRAPETAQPPATIKGGDFVPPPTGEGAFPFNPEQGSEAPVFTPVAGSQGNAAPDDAVQAKQQNSSKPASAPAKPARTYKVKRGDYLSVIAYMYKVNTQDLAAENDMQINATLYEGRVLKLPEYAAETPRPRPVIKKKPAQQKAPAKPKNDKAATKNDSAKADGAASGDVHVVQANENFWTIVRNNKVKAEDVRALNPQIKDFSKLQIGDKIRLRASNAVAAAPKQNTADKAPAKAEELNVPIAPVQIDAQVTTQEQAEAPAPNAAEADAQVPVVKPVPLSPSMNFNQPLPMSTTPAVNPGNATAE